MIQARLVYVGKSSSIRSPCRVRDDIVHLDGLAAEEIEDGVVEKPIHALLHCATLPTDLL